MNLIQELPSKYRDSSEQRIPVPTVQMTPKAHHQYGAVQPPFTFDQKHGAMQGGLH